MNNVTQLPVNQAEPVEVLDAETQMAPIESIEHFAHIVIQWHTNSLAKLRHMREVPDGTEFTFNDEELVATGDMLKGLKAGLTIAIAEMQKLPFSKTESTDDNA